MVTKTRQKKPPQNDDFEVAQIAISEKHAFELAECCGMDKVDAGYSEKLVALRREVNSVLSNYAHEIKLAAFKPQPAHMTAHLEQILHHATALAGLLHLDNITPEVLVTLSSPTPPDLNMLRRELDVLNYHAEDALGQIKDLCSRGAHNKTKAHCTQAAQHALKAVFENQTVRKYDGDKSGERDDLNEFIKICMAYLPD